MGWVGWRWDVAVIFFKTQQDATSFIHIGCISFHTFYNHRLKEIRFSKLSQHENLLEYSVSAVGLFDYIAVHEKTSEPV